MSQLLEDVTEKALHLSPREKQELIHRLLDAAPDEEAVTDPAMLSLAEERLREMENGLVSEGTHEEMMGRLRAKLECAR